MNSGVLTGKVAAVVSAATPVKYQPSFNAALSEKTARVSVAAHLRGIRPTPSTKKDTLMLREKLKL